MKLLELNGHKYSKDSFDDYKFRVKVTIKTVDDVHQFDIYTTDESQASVENVLLDRKTDKVTSLQITYWCTREQDDASAKMIEEWLNDTEDGRVYDTQLEADDDIMTVKDWNAAVKDGCFHNGDGSGYWVIDGFACRDEVFSSTSLDATHMVWYNK